MIILVGLIFTRLDSQSVDTAAVIARVDSLNKLTSQYYNGDDFQSATKLNSLALQISLEKLGSQSLIYARSLFIKGKLHMISGEFKETEKCYLEYSSILLKIKGEDNMDYAWSLDDLGQLYDDMEDFDRAETLFLRSGALIEKLKGRDHPDFAWHLNDLASMYRNMGAYEKAEPLYLEAKAIREKAMGKNHSDYAWSLNNLANLYNFMGLFERAEPYYMEALKLWELLYGKEHSSYASGLNNLASLYFNMGVYDKVEPLLLESCTLRARLLGKNNPDYAACLNNLGSLYMQINAFFQAESFLLESMEIRDSVYGREHAEYANSLGNLGVLYGKMGLNNKSESFFVAANSIWEKAGQSIHPDYAANLINLSNFYLNKGDLNAAEPFLTKANEIYLESLGKEHPDFLESQRLLSELLLRQGRIQKAVHILEGISSPWESQLLKSISFLSEHELVQFTDKFQSRSDELCTYFYACGDLSDCSLSGKLASIAYDRFLFYKGFLLSAAARLNSLAESTAESREIYNRLKSYRRRLADEYTRPIKDRASVEELEEKANSVEKELVYLLAGYSEAARQVLWQDIQSALSNDEAAIEFVHAEMNFPILQDSILYVALLIRKNAQEPLLIPLFEEKSLLALLNGSNVRKADYVNLLYSISDRGASPLMVQQKSLYQLIWEPLEKELMGVKTIYFSPSGLIHRLNLEAIPVTELETLGDQYKLIEMNSTRQLVIPTTFKRVNNDAFLFGGIQFDPDSASLEDESALASRSGTWPLSAVDSTVRGETWNYLAGTEREINALEKIMQGSGLTVHSHRAHRATEESFKSIGRNGTPSPRILHLATHGYFFPDRTNSGTGRMTHDPDSIGTSSDPSSQRYEGIAKAASIKPQFIAGEEPVFKISDHPMLRSGLILAGGNAAWQGKQMAAGREDGILTAYEISQMNLSNTELVVLSACETGLGDIQGNEGVYGLQRAFKIAGVKYIIMSLWQVPDKQTSMLMTSFYRKLLEQKLSIPDAFHAAQKELREMGLDPYQWAGFVLVE